MGANSTELTEEEVFLMVSSTIYFLLGVMILLGNFVIITTFMARKELHKKEMYLPVAMAVSDGLAGLGLSVSGGFRLSLVFFGDINEMVSVKYCLYTLYSMLIEWQLLAPTVFLAGMTTERFWASYYPISYFKSKTARLLKFIFLLYVACIGITLFFVGLAGRDPNRLVKIQCQARSVFPYVVELIIATIFVSLICEVAYIFIAKKVRAQTQAPDTSDDEEFKKQKKYQRTVTNAIMYVVIVDFFLHVIPKCIISSAILGLFKNIYIANLSHAIMSSNLGWNVVVYVRKYKDFREAVIKVYPFCKLCSAGATSGATTIAAKSAGPGTAWADDAEEQKEE